MPAISNVNSLVVVVLNVLTDIYLLHIPLLVCLRAYSDIVYVS